MLRGLAVCYSGQAPAFCAQGRVQVACDWAAKTGTAAWLPACTATVTKLSFHVFLSSPCFQGLVPGIWCMRHHHQLSIAGYIVYTWGAQVRACGAPGQKGISRDARNAKRPSRGFDSRTGVLCGHDARPRATGRRTGYWTCMRRELRCVHAWHVHPRSLHNTNDRRTGPLESIKADGGRNNRRLSKNTRCVGLFNLHLWLFPG